MRSGKFIYYLSLSGIVVISYLLYSSRYFPLLNSDDALNILMAFYYKLPQDLYCWGQDRGGSLIPMMSQVFHKIFGFSAVNSVSISNYLLLILGFIGFSTLLKNRYYKLALAIIWFLPPIRFIDLTRFPLGMQYSLLGFSIFVINNINLTTKKNLYNQFLILATIVLFSITIWVSDLSIVSISLILFMLTLFNYKKSKLLLSKWWFHFYLITALVGNYFFIRYAKSLSTGTTQNYLAFNDWNSFQEGLIILKTELSNIFKFRTNEPITGIFGWLIIAFLIVILFIRKKQLAISEKSKLWLSFFIADFLTVFCIILLSKWVYLNGMGRWYFVPLYITFAMALLIFLDNIKFDRVSVKAIQAFVFIIAITGAISTPWFIKFVYPKTFRSTIDVRAEFLELGQIGVIGEFWNSYITACPDPSKIIATAHEGKARNQELVDKVFAQPNLYLIKDMWMESFPNTLEQLGYILIKDGDSFSIGDCVVNKYVKTNRNQIIGFDVFQLKKGVKRIGNEIKILKDSSNLNQSLVMWGGPFIPIGKGNFELQYTIRCNSFIPANPIAKFDVAAEYGNVLLKEKELIIDKVYSDSIVFFTIPFSTAKRYSNLEFRIFFYGEGNLNIENIKLTENDRVVSD